MEGFVSQKMVFFVSSAIMPLKKRASLQRSCSTAREQELTRANATLFQTDARLASKRGSDATPQGANEAPVQNEAARLQDTCRRAS